MPRRPEIAQKWQKRPEFPEFQKCPELRSLSIRIFLGSRFLTRDRRAVRSTRGNTRFPRWSKNDAILPVNLPNGSPFKIFPSTKISIKDEKSALSKFQSRGYTHQCEPKASSPALKLNFVSSVRSSYSHPDLLVTQHPTFSDHTGPQHWTFTFWATTAI